MKYCIVTYLFNNYDNLKEPLEIDPECDYICFTDDRELTSNTYRMIYLEDFNTDALTGVQKMLLIKYQLHKYIPNVEKYDYIVRLDGSIKLCKSLRPIILYLEKYKYDMSVALHFERTNFIEEYNTWMAIRHLDKKYYDIFLRATSDYDYTMSGLIETTFQIYRNCKEVYNFLEDLHARLTFYNNNQDNNDQCWFTYVLYKHLNELRVNYHPSTLYRFSDYMKYCGHGVQDGPFHPGPLPYQQYCMFLNNFIRINSIEDYTKALTK